MFSPPPELEYMKFIEQGGLKLKNCDICICIYCGEEYPPENVKLCTNNDIICPECDIDSVIPATIDNIDFFRSNIRQWRHDGFGF